MARYKFDKARAEKIIRALTELGCNHENICRILNYEFDVPDVTFIVTHDKDSKKSSYGTLREMGGHDIFLEI